MIRRRFHFRETIATILADREEHVEAAREGLMRARQDLEHWIAGDPYFVATLEPYEVHSGYRVVDRMSASGLSAGVGPMAAVAAAIAWQGVEAMVSAGARLAVIDNGGDIVMVSDRTLRVGVHAGLSPLSDRMAFVVPPQEAVLGICTSSSTVGPSLSFGTADAVTVFARDPALSDAWATAICNQISPGCTGIMDRVPWETVMGVFAVQGDWAASFGTVPPVEGARVDPDLITGGPW
jgi:hypothetical protein